MAEVRGEHIEGCRNYRERPRCSQSSEDACVQFLLIDTCSDESNLIKTFWPVISAIYTGNDSHSVH